jgi:hypothetical protein
MIYSELKSSIADFLNRQDLTSVIPTFILLCEADLNRTVRHKSMLCRATAVLDTHFTALPSDFLEAKNIQLNTTPVKSLEYMTMEHADEYRATHSTTGVPNYYTFVGETLEVVPEPADSYTIELVYYKKISALSDSSTSNWLLASHPDVYLYGALMQAAPYLKDDERIPVWGQLYKAFIGDLNSASDKSEYSGSSLKMRTKWA